MICETERWSGGAGRQLEQMSRRLHRVVVQTKARHDERAAYVPYLVLWLRQIQNGQNRNLKSRAGPKRLLVIVRCRRPAEHCRDREEIDTSSLPAYNVKCERRHGSPRGPGVVKMAPAFGLLQNFLFYWCEYFFRQPWLPPDLLLGF